MPLQVNLKRKATAIAVPTNNRRVRGRIREMGEPVSRLEKALEIVETDYENCLPLKPRLIRRKMRIGIQRYGC